MARRANTGVLAQVNRINFSGNQTHLVEVFKAFFPRVFAKTMSDYIRWLFLF